jgi:hypothetical protein
MTDLLDMPAKPVRLNASDIRVAMAKRWTDPEYAIMWEVGEGTGATRGRYADAVIMSLWPSRGLELHGVEIKISRSDWKREAADPQKAEAIARFCDRWWIHTPPNVVDDLSALPPAWGLREFDGKGWKTIREAQSTEAEPVTRRFLAAMLRRADGMMRAMINEATREGRDAVERERQKVRDQYAEQVERAVERKTADLAEAAKNVAAFEAAFGEASARNWSIDFPRLGNAARALCACMDKGYLPLAERLRKAADEIDAIAAMSAPEVVLS